MTVHVTVDASRLNRILRNLGDNTSKAVRQVAFMVEGKTKINIREQGLIDTGAMLNSVYTKIGGDSTQAPKQEPDVNVVELPTPENNTTAHVGPSVEYAIYHELGTRLISARPFLGPAVESVAGAIERNPDVFRQAVTDDSQ